MTITGRRRGAVGTWGEGRAALYLERLGWRILERNWRCPAGELDIVAEEPGAGVVLVEVKTRSGRGYGDPLEAITMAKQAKLRELAQYWRRAHERGGFVRIDAIGVLRERGRVEISHVRGAA